MPVSPLCFVLINQSTLTDPQYGGPLDAATLQTMADSLAAYLTEDVAPSWGGVYQVRVGAPDASDLASGEVGSYIVDSLAQFPGAAALHDITAQGSPVIYAARNEFQSLIGTGDPLVSALSEGIGHELSETVVDPGANQWADRQDGTEEAKEACDRLQGTGYQKDGIMVPNFLLPPAFNPGAPGPWDFKGVLASQYDVAPYGYVILRNIGVMMNQEKGEATLKRVVRVQGTLVGSATGPHADARRDRKKHPVSRTYQRGIRIGLPA